MCIKLLRRLYKVLFCALCALVMYRPDACAGKGVNIIVTTGMLADAVENVAGDVARVEALMGPSIDPHLYKLTRGDIVKLYNADIVFYNGLHLEGRMLDAIDRLVSGGRAVFGVGEYVDHKLLLSEEEFPDVYDPHIWMDPVLWMEVVNVIRDKLSELLPEYADEFANNAEKTKRDIMQLHEYAQKVLGTIPRQKRILITAHDAFRYFGRRYNIKVIGIQGINTESEAGLREIERLVDLVVSRKIEAVFGETTVSNKNVNAIIEGAQARGWKVKMGGRLYSDAMGSKGTYEGTYIGMLDHNITTITNALGGKAPPKGMNGKLSDARNN